MMRRVKLSLKNRRLVLWREYVWVYVFPNNAAFASDLEAAAIRTVADERVAVVQSLGTAEVE
jgi:hypothetical protein